MPRIAKPIPNHPYHAKSDAALCYILWDAREAAKAMRDHDPVAEAKYLDQINDASTVLHWRRQTGRFVRQEGREPTDAAVSHAERHAGA